MKNWEHNAKLYKIIVIRNASAHRTLVTSATNFWCHVTTPHAFKKKKFHQFRCEITHILGAIDNFVQFYR